MSVMTQTPQQLKRTALAQEHERLGAKMVDFHGWWMPLYYTGIIPPPAGSAEGRLSSEQGFLRKPPAGGGIIEEHRCVRERVGLFDVSHMGQIFLSGEDAASFLQRVLTNDVGELAEGRGLYSLMLNDAAGILDDVILFRIGPQQFLLIVNCGTHERDAEWLRRHVAAQRVTIEDAGDSRCIIAAQGPRSADILARVMPSEVNRIKRFAIEALPAPWERGFISRTGYTGSDGFELFVPRQQAVELWRKLLDAGQPAGLPVASPPASTNVSAQAGAQPIGLGARDSLRLEVGYRLYGVDMSEETTPDEAGLERVVAAGKGDFLGRDALLKRRAAGIARRLTGFTMLDAGLIPRAHYPIHVNGRAVGEVTSGTLSPLLGIAIGLGYVEAAFAKSPQPLTIQARGREYRAQVIKLPFVQVV